MNAAALVEQLRRSGETIATACEDVGSAESRWQPAPGKWSLVEVASHLLDEERDDFRARLRSTLEDPAAAWAPIDPEGWARDRDYRGNDLAAVLSEWRAEREASLAWLQGLLAAETDWGTAHDHPHLGVLRAGDLLAAWAAHDQLHLRQVTNLRLAWIDAEAEPFHKRYAAP